MTPNVQTPKRRSPCSMRHSFAEAQPGTAARSRPSYVVVRITGLSEVLVQSPAGTFLWIIRAVLCETSIDSPITNLATSQTSSPKRGSVTCFKRSLRIGSSRTSSRPESAISSPSRCINSCIKENAVVGGTFYRKYQ